MKYSRFLDTLKIGNIRAIINDDDTCIGDELAKTANSSQRLQIAVAFLSDDNLIRRWIKEGKQLEVLVARRYPTNPHILRYLIHTPGSKIELKWRGPEFHAKVIIGCTKSGTPQWTSIGSANFTTAGLGTNDKFNDEFNVITKDKVIIHYALDWFHQLWETASYVNPEELKRYEDEYDKVQKVRTREPPRRTIPPGFDRKLSKIIKRYKNYWYAVDTVAYAVRSIVRRRFPTCRKYPYLVLWSFWDWLKNDCPTSAKHSLRQAVTKGDVLRRDNLLRDLFRKYSDEHDPQWPLENVTKMRRMKKMILRGRLPSTAELVEIIDGGYRNESTFDRNSRRKRLNSLKYLLQMEGEDVLIRAARLLRDPKYALKGAKEAAIFGWLGWAYPKTYPAMNKKATDGLKELGLL